MYEVAPSTTLNVPAACTRGGVGLKQAKLGVHSGCTWGSFRVYLGCMWVYVGTWVYSGVEECMKGV